MNGTFGLFIDVNTGIDFDAGPGYLLPLTFLNWPTGTPWFRTFNDGHDEDATAVPRIPKATIVLSANMLAIAHCGCCVTGCVRSHTICWSRFNASTSKGTATVLMLITYPRHARN